jgi:hypothetical protein
VPAPPLETLYSLFAIYFSARLRRARSGRLYPVSRYANLHADAGHLIGSFSVFFVGMLSMAYLLQPVNKPYDPEEPMPTPLGFVANIWAGGGNEFKHRLTPVPRDRVPKSIEIGSNRLDVQPGRGGS